MEYMEKNICLDTDILVNFLRNKPTEVAFIQEHERKVTFATTGINLFELYYGAYKSGLQANVESVHELRQRLKILPTSHEAMQRAGQLLAVLEKKGMPIEFRDLLIGNIAVTEGFSMKTNNTRHFQRISGLILME